MAQLIINRRKSWMHRMQPLTIFCDDQNLGLVGNGETKTFQLNNGVHLISAQMSIYHSRKMEVILKEEKPVSIEITIPKWLIFGDIIAASIVATYFLLKLFIDMDQLNYLPSIILVFAAVYMIYNLTFVRNRYFKLSVV